MESRDSEGDEKEGALLSSLLGLMCYCRAMVFDDLDGKNSEERKRSRCDGEDISSLNPKDFKCPITLLSLAINGGLEVGAVLQSLPSLTGTLYSVLTDGSSHASKKVRILLRLLHGGHHPGSSVMPNPTVRQERAAVRVR